MLKANLETNRPVFQKNILILAFALGCLMEGCMLSFESVNWFVGLHFVAPAKSQYICLDLILND